MPFYDSIENAWFAVRSKASHTFASRLYHAVPESFSFAQAILQKQLGDISLDGVVELLLKTAAYVLVSYAASSLIGGVAGGAGAALASRGGATRAGVLAGMRAGLAVNTWLLELLGFGFMAAEVKMHQEYAFRSYESGLQKLIEPPRSCWNEDSVERAAASDFALGHAKMLQGLIFGIVAYMNKGALQKERALEAMRASKVFGGTKMADWFAKNWDRLSARQRASAAVTPEMLFGKPTKPIPQTVRQPEPKPEPKPEPNAASFTTKQLDKKFKHASDFGINTTKKNPATLEQFKQAIEDHMNDPATKQHGTYLYVKDSKVFFNEKTNNVVVLSKDNEFVSGWKLAPETEQLQNYLENGALR